MQAGLKLPAEQARSHMTVPYASSQQLVRCMCWRLQDRSLGSISPGRCAIVTIASCAAMTALKVMISEFFILRPLHELRCLFHRRLESLPSDPARSARSSCDGALQHPQAIVWMSLEHWLITMQPNGLL